MFLKKKQARILIFGCVYSFFTFTLFGKHLIPVAHSKNIGLIDKKDRRLNQLKSVTLIPRTLYAEESEGNLYQLRLHFDKSLNFDKECDDQASTIKLSFYNVNKENLEAKHFVETCQKISFVKNITISTEEYPIARTVVTFECFPQSALIKIQKNSEAKIIDIDFYDKYILTKIKQGTDILRMAYNQTVLPRLA